MSRDAFTLHGHAFSVTTQDDDYQDPPWSREDGHGPVSEWTNRDKLPGEWVLAEDRGRRLLYDSREAQRIAVRDRWGPATDCSATTRKARAAAAVREDFERLRRWCAGDWAYVGVTVTADETGEAASLWGVESDSGDDYLREIAESLAAELCDAAGWSPRQVRARRLAAVTEAREAQFWAARDVQTIRAQPGAAR